MSADNKTTALYCRLSKDDDRGGESMSIENQKLMLVQYAKERNLTPYQLYVDDGFSGLNFERPGFQQMLEDIATGQVGTVVTKDLSRLGRDHLMVGQYTEIYFPTHGIRYIAINDGVDTADEHSNDFAAIKNVINEFYSRDTSRKIKASIKSRAKEGKYRTTVPPFGYLKDPEDNNHLIPDPEYAHVIPKIYELVIKGWGNYRIRDYLRETRVPIPAYLHHQRGWLDRGQLFPTEESKYIWRPDTLRNLIRNRVYCGDTVNCKSATIFKTKKHPKTKKDDWIIVENTHEPLVSREVWERANEMIKVRRVEYKEKQKGYVPTLFRGLLKCADCGYALSRRNYGSNSDRIIYACGRYCTYGAHRCSQHKLFEDDLIEAVKADINEKAKLALEDKDKLIQLIVSKGKKTAEEESGAESMAKRMRKRLTELEYLIDKLYEEHIIGNLSEDNYQRMMLKYQEEQRDVGETIRKLNLAEKDMDEKKSDAEKLADLFERNGEVDELTSDMLNTLIDRIEVHEAHVVDGVAYQEIDIFYRFVGVVNSTEYASTTFYKHGEVAKAAKKRSQRKNKERLEAVQNEIQNS